MISENNAINSMPTLQISVGIVTLFEKIYDGEPILTVFFVSGEDLPHLCFSKVYYVRTVSQPDIDAAFHKHYKFKMTPIC